MYSKTNNYATFMSTPNMEHTDKVCYGRVITVVKTGRKDESGKDIFARESWNARFVGKARELAMGLVDNTKIDLTEWSAHTGFNRDRKMCFPYLMVVDFDVVEESAKEN